jgi:hypothetical protein
VLFLHSARDIVVRDLARHSAVASGDEAGDRSYIWEARRHFMKSLDKLSDWKLRRERLSFPLGFEK